MNDRSVYDRILPFPDAQEYLEKLNSDPRFKVYIATNTYYSVYTYKMEKVLFEYFPFLKSNQIICIANKQLLKCDILIDDYHCNLIGGSYDKILISKPYNYSCETKSIKEKDFRNKIIKRTNNWEDIYQYIIEKTEKNKW